MSIRVFVIYCKYSDLTISTTYVLYGGLYWRHVFTRDFKINTRYKLV